MLRAFVTPSAAEAGGSTSLSDRITAANTAAEAFSLSGHDGVALGNVVARAAQAVAMDVVAGRGIAIEVVLFDRDGRRVGHADFAPTHDAPPRNLRR